MLAAAERYSAWKWRRAAQKRGAAALAESPERIHGAAAPPGGEGGGCADALRRLCRRVRGRGGPSRNSSAGAPRVRTWYASALPVGPMLQQDVAAERDDTLDLVERWRAQPQQRLQRAVGPSGGRTHGLAARWGRAATGGSTKFRERRAR
eukprot:TRINITY_DN42228_c0_g1_i1.p2 TRINITY_DN42228_c0_g1~~TRINITY_DN42228_c0_g1_i1.p2  ORF type:complete len:150 (+),score=4.70 TRINITY_DN42228_c0_g1_i1:80-529(+)